MSKYGENIYRRKDGRWEARYIFMRLPDGKAKYKSVYGKTHDIAKEKQLAGMLALAQDETKSCDLTVKELLTQYLAQADVKTPRANGTGSCWSGTSFRILGRRPPPS